MKESPVVAVVCGGPSAEAEVSRVSGRCVAEALRATYFNVSLLEQEEFVDGGFGALFADVVFPALHGPPGEDGTFQGFLDVMGLPYVGCDVPSSACAMDKVIAKQLFRSRDLPVADDVVVYEREGAEAGAQRVVDTLGQDVVIKPSSQGSALGIVFGKDVDDLAPAIEQAFAFDDRVLIERRIEGKEITVAILERDGDPEALPVVEITTPAGSWYDYEHRYTPGLSDHIMPAPLSDQQYLRTQEVAVLAFETLGCRDLSRADFMVPEEGEPILLELNTMPGMTPTSLFPDAAREAGISFEELTALLIERAVARRS
ncbi:MAG: D-alanine--D-alanine ligase [Acidobacteria bacterium]|nr:D-alanine--D-alanine ligase [Acidobacteriota bacterium]